MTYSAAPRPPGGLDEAVREEVRGAAGAAPGDHPPACLRTGAYARGDRVVVTVAGEIGLATEHLFQRALHEALGRSAGGVDLDLGAVEFFDCSGLNVLLGLRRRALREGRTVALRAACPAVDRVLTLTGTRHLFTAPEHTRTPYDGDGDAGGTGRRTATARGQHREDEHDLRVEIVQLRRAMQTRPPIDMARGMLMASFGLGPEEAWTVLVTLSQRTNTKLHLVAQALVDSVRGGPLPQRLRHELAAAVGEAGPGAPEKKPRRGA